MERKVDSGITVGKALLWEGFGEATKSGAVWNESLIVEEVAWRYSLTGGVIGGGVSFALQKLNQSSILVFCFATLPTFTK